MDRIEEIELLGVDSGAEMLSPLCLREEDWKMMLGEMMVETGLEGLDGWRRVMDWWRRK